GADHRGRHGAARRHVGGSGDQRSQALRRGRWHMTTRVEVKPKLLYWACERARLDELEVATRFPKFEAWLTGAAQPTFKQLEAFARATHTPIGYFFLPEP